MHKQDYIAAANVDINFFRLYLEGDRLLGVYYGRYFSTQDGLHVCFPDVEQTKEFAEKYADKDLKEKTFQYCKQRRELGLSYALADQEDEYQTWLKEIKV